MNYICVRKQEQTVERKERQVIRGPGSSRTKRIRQYEREGKEENRKERCVSNEKRDWGGAESEMKTFLQTGTSIMLAVALAGISSGCTTAEVCF